MATSFLQYCCRRKDNSKQAACPSLFSSAHESSALPTLSRNNPPEIIPQFTPTKPPIHRHFPSPASEVDHPSSPDRGSDDRASINVNINPQIRPYSAAAESLRQLQLNTTARRPRYPSYTCSMPSTPTFGNANPYRPALLRSNPSSVHTTPSLSAASSRASSPPASFPHNHPSYGSSRPLPPRSQSAACSASPRSIELVTPHLSAPPHTNHKSRPTDKGSRVDGGDLLYEKNWILPTVGRQTGSLKKLFNFEGMQGKPAITRVGSSGYSANGYVSTTEYEMAVATVTKGEGRIVPAVMHVGGRNGTW